MCRVRAVNRNLTCNTFIPASLHGFIVVSCYFSLFPFSCYGEGCVRFYCALHGDRRLIFLREVEDYHWSVKLCSSWYPSIAKRDSTTLLVPDASGNGGPLFLILGILTYIINCHWYKFNRYGKCFRTNIFRETHVFVSSTESAKAILNNDSRNFTKRYIRSIAELVGDQSLLCASHQQHKLIRSRLINLFSVGSISSFTQQFDELIVNTLSGWDKRETVVILDQALKVCVIPC